MKIRISYQSLQEPLLGADGRTPKEAGPVDDRAHDTFWPCAMNFAKAITGAGMMAIPRAYLAVGSLLGTSMLLGVAVLTYFTMAVLVYGSARTGAATYSQLVQTTCGHGVMKVLQLSVVAFTSGFSVVYLVVIRDILLGSPPTCSGLLCELFGLDPTGPLANPRVVIAAVALLLYAPLLLLRSMDSLAFLNVVGVAAVVLVAAVAAFLGGQALATGTAHALPLFPQWALLGPTKAEQLESLADIVPVILACYVGHQNIFPLMPLLEPYTRRRMCMVIAVALALSASVFTALAAGAALAFGPTLEVNVLNNFSEEDLAPLVGPAIAAALSWVIRGGYLVSVLGSLLLFMYPLRSTLADMLWGSELEPVVSAPNAAAGACPAADSACCSSGSVTDSSMHSSVDAAMVLASGDFADVAGSDAAGATAVAMAAKAPEVDGQQEAQAQADTELQHAQVSQPVALLPHSRRLEQRWYYPLTYSLLLAMVLVAILVPSIWSMLSAVGDLASTTQAFMIPGFIAIVLAVRYGPGSDADSGGGSAEVHGQQSELQASSDATVTAAAATLAEKQPGGKSDLAHAGSEVHGGEQVVLLVSPSPEPPVQVGSFFQRLNYWREKSPVKRFFGSRMVGAVVYVVLGGFVVLLGMALFANGVWQRV